MTFLSPGQLPEHPIVQNIDKTGRQINYLRISVTDRCNLACMYCVPRKNIPRLSYKKIARYEELVKIVNLAADIGISKVRITGGEPLVRKGIFTFIKKLHEIKNIRDIAVTTNGGLLKKQKTNLRNSGIKRLNISLDTLDPEKFEFITGKNYFEQVWQGIMTAYDMGISPIKLNCVVMKHINGNEITDLAALSLKYPFHVRFIEYMPMGSSIVDETQQMLIPEIREILDNKFGPLVPVQKSVFDGPAKRFRIRNAPGEIGFISPISSHFCSECNRIRLTSTGRLRPCLLRNTETDILGPLRQGALDSELKDIIKTVIKNKPAAHGIENKTSDKICAQMSEIGG
ncbi:MAG: GTP 3',8-cyclase MoaA [Thermodesulfobacteriota bacterium]|nr:GTP 3',8-cyclase MoaA [Thermodesulfobacteriota bacterium]